MTIRKDIFGTTRDGESVERYTIENSHGISIALMSFGANLLSCRTPDRSGVVSETTIGFKGLERYFDKYPYFGSSVGRFANRIAKGVFVLGGKTYKLAVNDGANHLHGGTVGFNKRLWKAEGFGNPGDAGVVFRRRSADREEGYPGNLDVEITYTLTEDNELILDYTARTDKATPVNLTNHTYWDLSGAQSGTILDHTLSIEADEYLPVDEAGIPLGQTARVEGGPMDFRSPKQVGRDLEQVGGYDHCYILRDGAGQRPDGSRPDDMTGNLRPAAKVVHPGSGRTMEILTTMPAIQFYTGNKLAGFTLDDGRKLVPHSALCLETEYYPDAVNQPAFPSPILQPGVEYRHRTVHRFSIS